MRSRATFLLLGLLGLLFMTSCDGSVRTVVYHANGMKAGEIELVDDQNATIFGPNGELKGRIRGAQVRNDRGGKAGTIEEREGHVLIMDTDGNGVGSLEQEMDCYGKTQEKLGRISAKIDSGPAAAACLLLLLPTP